MAYYNVNNVVTQNKTIKRLVLIWLRQKYYKINYDTFCVWLLN